MREPRYERMALLGEAIHCATEALMAPIDRVEVTNEHVRCWAGSKTVTLAYYCSQTGSHDEHRQFTPYAGGGSWRVLVVPDPDPSPNPDPISRQPEVIGRAFAKFLKKRGW
jgi:hypothetical protein